MCSSLVAVLIAMHRYMDVSPQYFVCRALSLVWVQTDSLVISIIRCMHADQSLRLNNHSVHQYQMIYDMCIKNRQASDADLYNKQKQGIVNRKKIPIGMEKSR